MCLLDLPHLAGQFGEDGREATGSATEDHLQRLTLALLGALINEDPYCHFGFAAPASKAASAMTLRPSSGNITIVPFADVPGEHSFAIA
jgi:hypothetical protein